MGVRILNGGEDIQAAVFGGRSSNSVITYMREQIERFTPLVKDNAFLQRSVDTIKHFTSEAFQRSCEAVAEMLKFTDIVDGFRRLTTIKEMQNANPTMQRYIMAHDRVRKMYLDGVIEGYEGSFENVRGNATGADLYEWRQIHNGIITTYDEPQAYNNGANVHWEATTYYDKTPEGEEPMTFVNQCLLLDTHRLIDDIFADSDSDLTSRLNNSL